MPDDRRARIRRRVLTVALTVAAAAVLVAVLRLVIGFPLSWAALVAAPVLGVLGLGVVAPPGAEPVWRPLPARPDRAADHQAATLATRLAEAHADQRRYRTRVQPRLRAAADAIARRHGLSDADDPAAPALFGPALHRLVTDRAAALPDPATTVSLLARLEEL
jgi:hypothetical protein